MKTKNTRFDELGQRMKVYEAYTTSTKLMPLLPIYCRIDGRAFHTFCKGLEKPFCYELVQTMQEVTKFLVEETHALLGYVQSDEINLCWQDSTKLLFDGKLFKLESILPSLATVKFVNYINCMYNSSKNSDSNKQWRILYNKVQNLNPVFDCRIFQLPNMEELANCFIWREIDAVRNSVQMLAQANFSHKELQGLKTKALQDKLLIEKDINWNDLSDDLKRGAYFKQIFVEKEVDNDTWNKIPNNKKPLSKIVKRPKIQLVNFPIMKKVENKTGVYFNNEEPVFYKDEN